MERRTFLKLAGAGALGLSLSGCTDLLDRLFGPEQEQLWGMNVHPYDGSLADLQFRALRELGIRKIRITLGLERDLAGRYIRGYPADYLGLLHDFDLSGLTPSAWPDLVRRVMARGHDLAAIEILNEPDLTPGLAPDAYVRDYLRPAWEIIKELRPDLPVVAAAPRGTQDGVLYFFDMTDAGANNYCDYRAVHLYSSLAEQFLSDSDKPFMITESGSGNPAEHVSWWSEEMPHFAGVLDTERLYFYALMEHPNDGHGIIADSPGPNGQVTAASALYDYIRENY